MKTELRYRVKFIDETNDDESKHKLVCQCDFPVVAFSNFNKEVEDYIYNVVLDLDAKYNFIEYEHCPYITINVSELTITGDKIKEKVIKRDDCIDYMFNL